MANVDIYRRNRRIFFGLIYSWPDGRFTEGQLRDAFVDSVKNGDDECRFYPIARGQSVHDALENLVFCGALRKVDAYYEVLRVEQPVEDSAV